MIVITIIVYCVTNVNIRVPLKRRTIVEHTGGIGNRFFPSHRKRLIVGRHRVDILIGVFVVEHRVAILLSLVTNSCIGYDLNIHETKIILFRRRIRKIYFICLRMIFILLRRIYFNYLAIGIDAMNYQEDSMSFQSYRYMSTYRVYGAKTLQLRS